MIVTLSLTAQQGGANFEFIENKGQWESAIKFKGDLSAGAFLLQTKGFIVIQHNQSDLRAIHQSVHGHEGKPSIDKKINDKLTAVTRPDGVKTQIDPITLRSHTYQVQFEGASENPQIVPDKVQMAYNNYFIGNDSTKWASNVKIFQAVTYKNVYPNIDVRYYSEYGRLKYDIIVNPGGDVSKIQMKYVGANKLSIKNKELLIQTSVSTVKELYPYTFQFDPTKGKKEIENRYRITNGNTVSFDVAGYDRNATLIIDPTLVFSTFTGSTADNYGFTATPGPGGTFFAGGIVFGPGYPITPGAFQQTFGGGSGARPIDMGITKFNSLGTQRLYSTYLGGSGNDFPHSLFSDAAGNLVVMGRSYSGTSYPGNVVERTPGAAQACDIVVTKLNAAGNGIVGSLRIGGGGNDGVNIVDRVIVGAEGTNSLLRNYGDESRSEVVMDGAGNIYVAAPSVSDNFPIVGGFQANKGALQDGIIMKINSNCNAIMWSSYLGGNANDGAFVLEINPLSGNVYVAGATASTDFPVTTSGVIQSTFRGGDADGFVAEIANNGSSIIKATYLGTPSVDIIYGIKFDRKGFPYVMGTTRGAWPVTAGVWQIPNTKQFVSKLRPDLSAFEYSTVFGAGTKPNMSPVAFLVDRCENVYISGWGGHLLPGTDPYDLGGVVNMPITPDAIKRVTDDKDLYFIVIRKDAAGLLYGSYFGQDGDGGEHVDGGTSRFDERGVIYQALCANCGGRGNFPTTPGVVAPVSGAAASGGCNLAAVKISFNFAGVAAGPRAFINGVRDTVGCVPLTIEFRDTVLNAKSYIWNFGDLSPDQTTSTASISHTYTAVGDYRIRLVAIDSATCNIADTAFITIKVRDDKADLAFIPVKLPPCESLSYRFDNLSTSPPGKPFGTASFIWDFGDGTRVPAGSGAVTHSYAEARNYKVRLILADTNYCNSPDSLEVDLRIAPNVKAIFETPPAGCAPYEAVFSNLSLAGQQFRWSFGDNTTSTQTSPTHLYNNVGTYVVKLVAIDSATCNVIDSTEFTIRVNPKPTAAFSFAPIVPEVNKPTIFTNLSVGGVRFKWLFGDGDSVVKTTMDTTSHQYNASGTYNACLIVYNQFDCTDTICAPVQAQIVPLLDVPNAFTPGKFGRNSIVRVEGFGIGKMTWRIYNRWGQVVFQTGDRKGGWDGTFKGQPQPMDVYAYTLEVEFNDGTRARKTGDITLIR
ncbi:MAG: PKD domain-containing protein [Chitinophagaceae bacterium]|nr:PKD domain-containing protein [Chitinophagaceae bacterium]